MADSAGVRNPTSSSPHDAAAARLELGTQKLICEINEDQRPSESFGAGPTGMGDLEYGA